MYIYLGICFYNVLQDATPNAFKEETLDEDKDDEINNFFEDHFDVINDFTKMVDHVDEN